MVKKLYGNWVRPLLDKQVSDVLWLLWGLSLRVVIVGTPIVVWDAITSNSTNWRFSEIYNHDNFLLAAVLVGAVILADYFKDFHKDRRRVKERGKEEVIFEQLAGLIRDLSRPLYREKDNYARFIDRILHATENMARIVYKKPDGSRERLSANLMVVSSQAPPVLEIKYWGTQLEGREDLQLEVDLESPAPGAPTAFVTQEPQYIPDTKASEVQEHFPQDKDYRAIISIPVTIEDGSVFAVINIDSSEENGFDSMQTISKRLMPRLKPLVHLLKLHKGVTKYKEYSGA